MEIDYYSDPVTYSKLLIRFYKNIEKSKCKEISIDHRRACSLYKINSMIADSNKKYIIKKIVEKRHKKRKLESKYFGESKNDSNRSIENNSSNNANEIDKNISNKKVKTNIFLRRNTSKTDYFPCNILYEQKLKGLSSYRKILNSFDHFKKEYDKTPSRMYIK